MGLTMPAGPVADRAHGGAVPSGLGVREAVPSGRVGCTLPPSPASRPQPAFPAVVPEVPACCSEVSPVLLGAPPLT